MRHSLWGSDARLCIIKTGRQPTCLFYFKKLPQEALSYRVIPHHLVIVGQILTTEEAGSVILQLRKFGRIEATFIEMSLYGLSIHLDSCIG